MANVFGILTAIVLALAAYIANKNKTAYDAKITATKEKQTALADTEVKLKVAKTTLTEELPAQRTEVEADVEKLTAQEAAQTKANTALEEVTKTKSAKLAENKAKLDDFREKSKNTGDIDQLAAKLKTTLAEVEELQQSITVAEAKLSDLNAQNTASGAEVGAAKTKFENFTGGQSLATLQTRIRSIYPNWGFVTLAAGNNAGVVANSTLNVIRDGEVIAKLLVTAVESGTASASIVPDSLSSDVTLAVGDRVVPGQKAAVSTPASAPVVTPPASN
ncbi:hypothetical protein JIN84_02365 [Luteolibacter yonseiensis]|uniref:Uncharacterized protein n=1 Tax=Luteolibacter yonseiensis TaxID=1144680 RepID=A0A934R0E3_9BACT|nr:hypothetical protein [Luteolibacter yonseiensis]MBK1814439.1 hypothetical protein [Luteolibacter yonseiensis]